MKVLHILWLMIFGLIAAVATLIALPVILLIAGIRLIGGMASKIR